MTDTVRSYTRVTAAASHKRRRGALRRRRWGRGSLILLLFLVLFCVYVLFATRDSVEPGSLVAGDHRYHIVLRDLVQNRGEIAASQAWQALPESLRRSTLAIAFESDLGLPDWVQNHLITRDCFVSGDDFRAFSDPVLVTKMTRLGAFLTRAHMFLPAIKTDPAGGLGLYHVDDPNLYYAVRGRVLAVSPSRKALIRALTLQSKDGMEGEAFAKAVAGGGSEQVSGSAVFPDDDAIGEWLRSLSFALRLDGVEARMKCRAAPSPKLQELLAPLIADASPQQLLLPPEGLMMVSADFGIPVESLWRALGRITGWPFFTEDQWRRWGALADEKPPDAFQTAGAMLGPLGPGIRLSWCGMDLNEIIPVPLLVVTLDTGTIAAADLLAKMPPPPGGAEPWESYPRLDEERKIVYVPMIGGPSIEPAAGPYGKSLLISNSHPLASELVASNVAPRFVGEHGNLYLSLRPLGCVNAIVDTGRLLAQYGLLKGCDQASFEELAKRWIEGARTLDQAELLAAVRGASIEGTVTIRLAGNTEK